MADRASDVRVRWVLIAVGCLFLITAAIAVTAVTVQGNRNAEATANEILDRIAKRTADLIDGQMRPIAVSLEQMTVALDESVSGDLASRERILAAQLSTMNSVSGAFIARADGSFEFVRRVDDDLVLKRITITNGVRQVLQGTLDDDLTPTSMEPIVDDFDPRDRVWYQRAMAEPGETVWTEPYVFFESDEPGVSGAIAVEGPDGAVRAIVGIDVTLTSLGQSVQNLPIDATADAYLIAEGLVIAAPADQSVVTTDPDGGVTLIPAEVLGLTGSSSSRVSTAAVTRSGLPEWSVAVRADRIGFVEAVRQQTRLAITGVGLALAIGMVLLVVIALRLRQPLDELATRVDRDPLTDLPNRRAIMEFGAGALRRAEARRADVTVAVLDIDHFKDINDLHGHAAGDEALKRLGKGLKANVRSSDLVGRYGGDEFVVILVDTDLTRGREAMAQIASAGEAELQSEPEAASATVSYGLAAGEGRAIDIDELIAEADEILLTVKRSRPPRPESAVARSRIR